MDPERVLLVVSKDPAYRARFSRPRPDLLTLFAPSAGEALDLLVERRPDILLLDLEGCEVPAIHLLHAARNLRRGVACVVLSPAPSAADAGIVEEGVFYYAGRPADPADLEPVLAAARRAAGNRAERERVGGPSGREATP